MIKELLAISQINKNNKMFKSLRVDKSITNDEDSTLRIIIYKIYNGKPFIKAKNIFNFVNKVVDENFDEESYINWITEYLKEAKAKFTKDFICLINENYDFDLNELYVSLQFGTLIISHSLFKNDMNKVDEIIDGITKKFNNKEEIRINENNR